MHFVQSRKILLPQMDPVRLAQEGDVRAVVEGEEGPALPCPEANPVGQKRERTVVEPFVPKLEPGKPGLEKGAEVALEGVGSGGLILP